jgi:hypothetical protein
MDDLMIATLLKNLDLRIARVEQVLPTLATKEDLKTLATREELKPLATREELKPLATKAELKLLATKAELKLLATKEDVREEGERSRRHMTVLIEDQDSRIQLLAEHLSAVMSKLLHP